MTRFSLIPTPVAEVDGKLLDSVLEQFEKGEKPISERQLIAMLKMVCRYRDQLPDAKQVVADAYCTPEAYQEAAGPHHLRYRGYHELAYLHPRYFTPDPAVLGEAGLAPGEPFTLVRFVGWAAGHDIGHQGLSL